MRHRAWFVLGVAAALAASAPATVEAQEKSKDKAKTRAKVERVKTQPVRSSRSRPATIERRSVKIESLSRKPTVTKPITIRPRTAEPSRTPLTRDRFEAWRPETVKPVQRDAGPTKSFPTRRGHDDRDPPDRRSDRDRGKGWDRDRGDKDDRNPPGRDKDWDRGRGDRDDHDPRDRDKRPRRGGDGKDDDRDRDRGRDRDDWKRSPRSGDGFDVNERRKWDRIKERPIRIRTRVVRERWVYGGYGVRVYDPFHYHHWYWYHDPFWHDHASVVFVFRRGHGHLFRHHYHVHHGHHHGVHLHHGYFHDYLFLHHGYLHFVILVRSEPVYTTVPVYHAPPGWVIEERDVPELIGDRVPGSYYESGSCAQLQIVTHEGTVLPIRVDPADFGAENVGQLRDILEEALAATGQLDLEDLAGVRHVIPRESIREIRGTVCEAP